MQISFRFGSEQGLCLLPAPSVPAGLCPLLSNPFTGEEQARSPLRATFPWENGKTPSRGDENANRGARGREEQRVASANCRKSDTVIQSCSGREGALVERWENGLGFLL